MPLIALPTHPILQRIHHFDKSLPGFHSQLCDVLRGQEYEQCVPNLGHDDSVWLVQYLDETLDDLDPSSPSLRRCLRALRDLCGTKAVLPNSYTLLDGSLSFNPTMFAAGDFSDVHEGTLNDTTVCVKRMRMYRESQQLASKIFYQEAVVWKHMKHPKILPFLGIAAPGPSVQPTFISGPASGGTLREYVKKRPEADRIGLLSDVAEGLHYLHSCGVIHGGIQGPDVFIDETGHALITDFSHATVVDDKGYVRNDSKLGPTVPWAAPEVSTLDEIGKQADIFSFAMLFIEVFTDAIPFSDNTPATAMAGILRGKRPPRPKHPAITGRVWRLIQRCWDKDPRLRPDAAEILQELNESNPPTWKLLIVNTLSMDERIPLITFIFSDHDEVEALKYLSRGDAQAFVNVIDEALDRVYGLPRRIRVRCLRTSYRICGLQALLPDSLQIPLCYNPLDIPDRSGGFADVWRCRYLGQEVAAKALKVYSTDDLERVRRTFCREVMTWRILRHPNVLPLLGVTMIDHRFVMVSQWMKNGNVNEFLKNNPDADRLELLRDVTNGLIYMHDQDIIHGDLKGANIMINDNRRACLVDFSLIRLAPDQSTLISTLLEGGTQRWMSPELLDPKHFGLYGSHPTKESDRFALGMALYEILSGEAPFGELGPHVASVRILAGQRPGRPEGERGEQFTDSLWNVLERCWRHKPGDRATAKEVLLCLGGIITSPSRKSSRMTYDGDAEENSDDQWDIFV